MLEELVTYNFLEKLNFKLLSDPYQTMQLYICPDFEQDHSIYLSWNPRLGFFYGPDHRPCPIPIQTCKEVVDLLDLLLGRTFEKFKDNC